MDRLATLQSFVRIVESGSFSQTARELGIGQPAVSKQVAALERRLGAQLLNRTSRGLRPTPAGADFYEAAIRILNELDDAEGRVASGQQQPYGIVRVAAPPIFTSMIIVPALPAFFADFPDVCVDLVVSERYADLVHEGIDLAIRVGNLDSSGLMARRIGSMQFATVATPDYLAVHGTPLTPSQLAPHHMIANQHLGATSDWHFSNDNASVISPDRSRFRCNNPADMLAAVLSGLGIGQSARGLFEAEIRSGRLVELLATFVPSPLPIYAVQISPRVPNRVRVLRDFIEECVASEESLRL